MMNGFSLDEYTKARPVQQYQRALAAHVGADSSEASILLQKAPLFATAFFPGKDRSLVLVGAGHGLSMLMLQQAGYVVTGVESDANAVDYALAHGLDVKNASPGNLAFPSGSASALISFASWPKNGQVAWLDEEYRVLRQGGYAVHVTAKESVPLASSGAISASKFGKPCRSYLTGGYVPDENGGHVEEYALQVLKKPGALESLFRTVR